MRLSTKFGLCQNSFRFRLFDHADSDDYRRGHKVIHTTIYKRRCQTKTTARFNSKDSPFPPPPKYWNLNVIARNSGGRRRRRVYFYYPFPSSKTSKPPPAKHMIKRFFIGTKLDSYLFTWETCWLNNDLPFPQLFLFGSRRTLRDPSIPNTLIVDATVSSHGCWPIK